MTLGPNWRQPLLQASGRALINLKGVSSGHRVVPKGDRQVQGGHPPANDMTLPKHEAARKSNTKMKKKSKAIKLSKTEDAKLRATVNDLVRKMNEVFSPLTLMGQRLITFGNNEARRKKFARLMRREIGKDWEDQLLDGPYGRIPGGDADLLERLDRAGKLKDGLTVQEVQKAAAHVLRVMAEGERAGSIWSAGLGLAVHKLDLHDLLNAPGSMEVAEAIGAAEEFRRRGSDGTAWLRGYILGAASDADSPQAP
jgi:hypothetical protein